MKSKELDPGAAGTATRIVQAFYRFEVSPDPLSSCGEAP
jgi:hypothetical protein